MQKQLLSPLSSYFLHLTESRTFLDFWFCQHDIQLEHDDWNNRIYHRFLICFLILIYTLEIHNIYNKSKHYT